LHIALDLLADMFLCSKFDSEDINKECKVITEEIDMYEDSAEDMVQDLLQRQVWQDNPLGCTVIGNKETISSFTRDTFMNYMKSNYSPQNTIITLAGRFNADEMIEKIRQAFGGFTSSAPYEVNLPKVIYTPSVSAKAKDIEQTHLCLTFPGLHYGDDRAFDLTAVNTMFGGGMSSRLFQKIREEHGLAYSVYSYITTYVDTGLMTIYTGFNVSQTVDVIRLMFEVVKEFFTDRITQEQLDKAREQLKSNYLLSLESTSSRMSSLGRSQLLLQRTLTEDEIVQKLDAVTLDSLYNIAERILDVEKASMCVLGRLGDWDYEELFNNSKV
jgi:predicted Zn-dependent peptidase